MTRSAYTLVLTLCLPATVAAQAPITVSPGSVTAETTVDDRCPSFSWGAVAGARAHELAVYRIDTAGEVVAEPVLRQRIPGAALSWTPGLRQCLEPGGRYAWSIRATGESKTSDWSAPRLFNVASGPDESDFQAALELVRRYLADGATEPRPGSVRAARPAVPAKRVVAVSGPGRPGGETRDPSAAAEIVGFKSKVEDTDTVSFGAYGLSTADENGSAGLVGETTAATGFTYGVIGRHPGGPGSVGAAGAFTSLGGGNVLVGFSNGSQVFRVDGNGDLFLPFGGLVCNSCIDGNDIASSSITGAAILNGSITGSDIRNGSVTGSDIATNSILETDLAAGSVGADELDGISVVSVECNGSCFDITLGQACAVAGPKRRPVSVDCDQVHYHSQSTSCGGDNACHLNSVLSAADTLGSLCGDQGGYDANVFCLDDDE